MPAGNADLPPAAAAWAELMLGFIAANRPFIVIFFLLAAAWSFFLTAPDQPAPALAGTQSGSAVPGSFPDAEEEYAAARKLHLVRRSRGN